MAEKRRRSCQDAPAVPPSDNGLEDTSVDAVIPSGAGPGRGACSLCLGSSASYYLRSWKVVRLQAIAIPLEATGGANTATNPRIRRTLHT